MRRQVRWFQDILDRESKREKRMKWLEAHDELRFDCLDGQMRDQIPTLRSQWREGKISPLPKTPESNSFIISDIVIWSDCYSISLYLLCLLLELLHSPTLKSHNGRCCSWCWWRLISRMLRRSEMSFDEVFVELDGIELREMRKRECSGERWYHPRFAVYP